MTEETKGAGTRFFSLIEGKTFDPENPMFDEKSWQRHARIDALEIGEITVEAKSETLLDDEDADWKDYTPGAKDAGEMSLTLVWNPADETQKPLNNLDINTKKWYAIVTKNGYVRFRKAFLTSIGENFSSDEKIKRTYKFRNCGKPVQDFKIEIESGAN